MDPTIGYQAKRFVIEDSITKVSSDGEPHGLITIIAGCSGVVAAIIILAILASITECRIGRRSGNENDEQQAANDAGTNLSHKRKAAIIVPANPQITSSVKNTETEGLDTYSTRSSLSMGSKLSRQEGGNLNVAFVNEEDDNLCQLNKENKSSKRAHFNVNEIDNIPLGELYKATETRIEIERF